MRGDVLCVGHASYDLIFQVDRQPGDDEKVRAEGMVRCGGGPAANAAVTVARLGGTAAYAGYLGSGIFGREHRREREREGGADGGMAHRGDEDLPLSAVLAKPDGRRTLVNYREGRNYLEPAGMPDSYPDGEGAAGYAVLLFDGHEPLLAQDLLSRLRRRGETESVKDVLDAGSYHRGTAMLWKDVTYLLASSAFAEECTGRQDPEAMCRVLADNRTGYTVVTHGGQGLWWFDPRGEGGYLPAFSIKAADTTGAGDVFHGAFSLALARGGGFRDSLIFGAGAAALSCQKPGARNSIPRKKELQDFFCTSPPNQGLDLAPWIVSDALWG